MCEDIKAYLKSTKLFYLIKSVYIRFLHKKKRNRFLNEYKSFAGEGYTCNACLAVYSKMANHDPSKENREALKKNNVIAGYGKNVFCPNCLCRGRDRLVIAMLIKYEYRNKKILHLSPEKQIFEFINKNSKVTTADLIPENYAYIDKKIQRADITNLVFADASFDLVIANHILEHVPDDRKAMKEIYRVLKPFGRAILQVPFSLTLEKTLEDVTINNPTIQSQLFGQKDHVRIYKCSEYAERLTSVGFRVEYIPYENLKEFHNFAIQPAEGFFSITK